MPYHSTLLLACVFQPTFHDVIEGGIDEEVGGALLGFAVHAPELLDHLKLAARVFVVDHPCAYLLEAWLVLGRLHELEVFGKRKLFSTERDSWYLQLFLFLFGLRHDLFALLVLFFFVHYIYY